MERRKLLQIIGLVAGGSVLFGGGLYIGIQIGQPKFRLSPQGNAELQQNGARVVISYGRPYARDREIFGGVVPYGKVWRTGANEATTLVTDRELFLGDARVPAGEYSLYTIPKPNGWTLIVNRQTGHFGNVYKEKEDLLRVEIGAGASRQHIEQFTIRFDETARGTLLHFEWESTRASVPVRLG